MCYSAFHCTHIPRNTAWRSKVHPHFTLSSFPSQGSLHKRLVFGKHEIRHCPRSVIPSILYMNYYILQHTFWCGISPTTSPSNSLSNDRSTPDFCQHKLSNPTLLEPSPSYFRLRIPSLSRGPLLCKCVRTEQSCFLQIT